jgi:hypothetical protein
METLRERNLGELQGYTRAEAVVSKPEALRASTSKDYDETIPVTTSSLNFFVVKRKPILERRP